MAFSRSTIHRKRCAVVTSFLDGLEYSSGDEEWSVPKVPRTDDANEDCPSYLNVDIERELISPCSASSNSERNESASTFHSSDENLLNSDCENYDCTNFDNNVESISDATDGDHNVKDSLRSWFIKYNITLSAFGALLLILQPFIKNLPRDPRTILKRFSSGLFEKMGTGVYYNFGLDNKVAQALTRMPPLSNSVDLIFHHDSVPLFKLSGLSYYPILCSLHHTGKKLPPFVVAIFCGKHKPPLDDFLKDFVPELEKLLSDGLTVNGIFYTFRVRCFICDAPARSYIKGTKGHGGYYGCDFCEQKGKWQNKVVFTKTKARLRTDESFASEAQPGHHRLISPLTSIGLKMVSMFPPDYMHLILLGVVRNLLFLWFDGKKTTSLAPADVKTVNKLMDNISRSWPCDFNNKPRVLDDIARWKATEVRQFLLYLGPSILKSRMSKGAFRLFMVIHVAITILCRQDLYLKLNDLADRLLLKAFHLHRFLFGKESLVYNVHNMVHLAKFSKVLGVLDSFSAFPFESYLGVLKRLTTNSKNPLKGLVSRLSAEDDVQYVLGRTRMVSEVDGPINNSMILHNINNPNQNGRFFKKFHWHSTVLSVKKGNNCVILKNNKVMMIESFLCTSSSNYVVGKKFFKYDDAYTWPCKSSMLGILKVSKLGGRLTKSLVENIMWKGVLVPYKEHTDEFFVFPLRN